MYVVRLQHRIEATVARVEATSESTSVSLTLQELSLFFTDVNEVKNIGQWEKVGTHTLKSLVSLLEKSIVAGKNVQLDIESPHDSSTHTIDVSLEASIVALALVQANDLPIGIYSEELLEHIIGLLRYHTTHNVFPAFDEGSRRLYRSPAKSSKKPQQNQKPGKKNVGTEVKRMIGDLCLICGMLEPILLRETLDDSIIAPLIGTTISTLLIDGIPTLQTKCMNLCCTIFFKYEKHRQLVFEDFIAALWKLPVKGRSLRLFPVPGKEANIQMATAFILTAIQKLVTSLKTFPDLQTMCTYFCSLEKKSVSPSYCQAAEWAHYFWKAVLERWPSSKSNHVDVKALMDNLVQDLMNTLDAPEWPASNLILYRLSTLLGGPLGVQNKEVQIKHFSLDCVGRLTSRIKSDTASLREKRPILFKTLAPTSPEGDTATAMSFLIAYLKICSEKGVSSDAIDFHFFQWVFESQTPSDGLNLERMQLELQSFYKTSAKDGEIMEQQRHNASSKHQCIRQELN